MYVSKLQYYLGPSRLSRYIEWVLGFEGTTGLQRLGLALLVDGPDPEAVLMALNQPLKTDLRCCHGMRQCYKVRVVKINSATNSMAHF
jgi:hypothetical protein